MMNVIYRIKLEVVPMQASLPTIVVLCTHWHAILVVCFHWRPNHVFCRSQTSSVVRCKLFPMHKLSKLVMLQLLYRHRTLPFRILDAPKLELVFSSIETAS